jgi:hypothetical protein
MAAGDCFFSFWVGSRGKGEEAGGEKVKREAAGETEEGTHAAEYLLTYLKVY